MEKATLIFSRYIPSERKPFQGTSISLERELNNGWKISSGDNGTYILTKPAQALFRFKTDSGTYQYDLRKNILNMFSMIRLSEKAFNRFKEQIENGNITVNISTNGYIYLR